jgi:hypothetical protein
MRTHLSCVRRGDRDKCLSCPDEKYSDGVTPGTRRADNTII